MRVRMRRSATLFSRLSLVDVARLSLVAGLDREGSVMDRIRNNLFEDDELDGSEIELLLPDPGGGLGDYAARMGDLVGERLLSEFEGRDQLSVFSDLAHADATTAPATPDQ